MSQYVKSHEEKRLTLIRKALTDVLALDSSESQSHHSLIRSFQDLLTTIDITHDMSIITNHLTTLETDFNQVSVRSLVNPLKAGRVFVKRGDTAAGWISNYFVLMGEEKVLYCFDGEDSESPREVIDLKACQVYSLDDSYFGRANCLQLVVEGPQHDTADDQPQSPTTRTTYNLIAESPNDKQEWIQLLRPFCYCCPNCATVYASSCLSCSEPPQQGQSTVRSLRLWVMEAKDLGSLTTANKLNPYCVVLFNDIKQARTGVRSGEAPFWGEEFRLSDIPPCRNRLRLLLFGAAGGGKRDTEIGKLAKIRS